eukprot:3109222-Rhodomonas_salina.2
MACWIQDSLLIRPCCSEPVLRVGSALLADAEREEQDLEEKICSFWFHTSFVTENRLVLARHELDGAVKKDKKMERFCAEFSVELAFEASSAKSDASPSPRCVRVRVRVRVRVLVRACLFCVEADGWMDDGWMMDG